MCGIFGILDRSGRRRPTPERLAASVELMRHRGPDADDIYCQGSIGLAHTRLAMLDPEQRSDQPFWSEDGRYCLLYNGEIYNYKELRYELEKRGIAFRTAGDTEVLLQALIHDGSHLTLPRLEGMFAFALLDTKTEKLTLGRDRFGTKPLHLYVDDDVIIFSSEARAMRPWIDLEPDSLAVAAYLVASLYAPRTRSYFRGVELLPPGTLVEFERGRAPHRKLFAPWTDFFDPEEAESLARLTPGEVVDRFDELLQDAVRTVLLADVPIGALVSGGIDSSLIAAVAARRQANIALFHANIKGPLSELPAARLLADTFGLDLQVADVEDRHFLDLSPRVTAHYERPFLKKPTSVPFLCVADLVRDNGIKGVLTGEAADELFLGYQGLGYRPLVDRYRSLTLRFERLIQAIPRFGVELWPLERAEAQLAGDLLARFESGVERDQHRAVFEERFRRRADREPLTLDLFGRSLKLLLHRNDSMGMAAGIESRFPFLSLPMVRAAVNLPVKYKVRLSPRGEPKRFFYRDKWVLRKLAERYLPKRLREKPKWPFRVSSIDRMRIDSAFFRQSWVAQFLGLGTDELAHLESRTTQPMTMKLVMLEVWGQVCILGTGEEEVAERLRRWASFGD